MSMLNPNVTMSNVRLLYADPDACFVAAKNGELISLSKWNLCSRFWRWLRNLGGGEDHKVNQAVYETLIKVKVCMDRGVKDFVTIEGKTVPYSLLATTIMNKDFFAKVSPISELSQEIINNHHTYGSFAEKRRSPYSGPEIIRQIASE